MSTLEKENASSIDSVDSITLKNQGGFVTRLEILCRKSSSSEPFKVGNTGDITLGFSKKLSLSDFEEIKDGYEVTAFAVVVMGKNNQGTIWFSCSKGCNKTAQFTISGTTLDNELGFNGIK